MRSRAPKDDEEPVATEVSPPGEPPADERARAPGRGTWTLPLGRSVRRGAKRPGRWTVRARGLRSL